MSVGAQDTLVLRAGEEDRATALVASIHASGRTAMVQPHVASVDERGERGLFFFGGAFSHAIGKGAVLEPGAGVRADLGMRQEAWPAEPTRAELGLARRAVAWLGERFGAVPAYARVDLVLGADDEPQLLELELTEPCLFFRHAPDGAEERFAAVLAAARRGRRLSRRGTPPARSRAVVDRAQPRRRPRPARRRPGRGAGPPRRPPRRASGGARRRPGRPGRPARRRALRPTSSGSAPIALATTGTPAAIASAAASPKVSAPREGTSATAARRAARRASASSTRPAKRTSPPAPAARASSSRAQRPVARDDERQPRPRAGVDRDVDALLRRQPGDDERVRRRPRPRARGELAHDVADDADPRGLEGARSTCRRVSAAALGTTTASAASTIRRCQSASDGRVDGPLRAVAAAVRGARPGSVSRPWQRVQSSPRR